VRRMAVHWTCVGLTALLTATLAVAATPDPARAGSIRGTVRFIGPPGDTKRLSVTVDHAVCGRDKEPEDLVLSSARGIRNAVVWVETPPPDAAWRPPLPLVQIDQRQCVFIPRVVVVPVGGTVEFLNGDRLLHNIHSASKENRVFNRTQPKGRTIPIVFTRPEIVRVDCDLHPWMRAWVVVAEHPHYAITNEQGEFVLDGVPAGRYRVRVWQETLGTSVRDVTVGDGATTLSVELSR